ncbi:MAG: 50S ribosomal protein L21 [Alphaproteobacteria bacterium]|nr:50S ribosomal protein L21 [Alphaproteobacteria bacterium]
MGEYAIFQTGGKQYRVKQGDIIKVEKLEADGKIEFDQVLMIGDKVGSPFVEGAKVVAEVVEQKRADKILVFKKKRRQNYRRTAGHRQFITVLKITEVKA